MKHTPTPEQLNDLADRLGQEFLIDMDDLAMIRATAACVLVPIAGWNRPECCMVKCCDAECRDKCRAPDDSYLRAQARATAAIARARATGDA